MLLKNRLTTAVVLLTLAGVACGDNGSASTETPADDDDANDDDANDDDANDGDANDGDANDDDANDDDANDDDANDDDDSSDDDMSGDDAGPDDDSSDDDTSSDDDVAGDDDAGLPHNGEACTVDTECNEGATCYEGICVQAGTGLRVSLTWDALADLDIHVFAPNGDEVWWNAPMGGGGVLDVDDCLFDEEFYCVDEKGTHVESVFFETPEPGDYVIIVYGYETGGESVDFVVRVFANDVEAETLEGSVATEGVAETTFTYGP